MRFSEHRRRPSHSSFRRSGGNQLCLQQINSITPPVDLVFFKTGGWTVTEWLPRIFNHLFTRWSLVRTNCVWGLIYSLCYFNLQWDLNPRIHSLVQGAALATCVWGLFHITILQNSVFVDWIGFEPMVLPEWEQFYRLSASTACIPIQNVFHFDAYYGEKCLGYEGERSIVPCMKEPLQLSVAIKDSLQFTTLPI